MIVCATNVRRYAFKSEGIHSSLLRTFGLNATSPYDSYLPLIFGKLGLI